MTDVTKPEEGQAEESNHFLKVSFHEERDAVCFEIGIEAFNAPGGWGMMLADLVQALAELYVEKTDVRAPIEVVKKQILNALLDRLREQKVNPGVLVGVA